MLSRYRLWPEMRVPPKAIVIKNFVPRRSPELPAAKPVEVGFAEEKREEVHHDASRAHSAVTRAQ
jgi:hypothetical protein